MSRVPSADEQFFAEETARLARLRSDVGRLTSDPQELITPLNEEGVELQPERPRTRCITGLIHRTFAWMLGRDRDSMRILRCDRGGILNTGGLDYNRLRKVGISSAAIPSAGAGNITFSADYDIVHIVTEGCLAELRFRDVDDVVVSSALALGGGAAFGATSNLAYGVYYCRARQVHAVYLDGPVGQVFALALTYDPP